MAKIVELLQWKTFLDVHLKKDPGLFPKYLAKNYSLPYEIVFMDANPKVSTKVSVIDEFGIINRLPPPVYVVKNQIIFHYRLMISKTGVYL